LAEAYAREYDVAPQIIYSAPPRLDIASQPPVAGRIKLIHHGGASSGRKIEDMIRMMDLLDSRFSLDLMLVGKGEYYSKLQALAARRPNVGWCDPVPMPEISKVISTYDMGLYLMPDTNFNHRVAIPNKLFEFIQARLAIAVSPIQGMADIVRQHELGVVSQDFSPESMARALNSLVADDFARFKQNAVQAATEFTAENEMDKLRKLLGSLVH
jgi:glycosyltransferase involved in cell wall biosynthesis